MNQQEVFNNALWLGAPDYDKNPDGFFILRSNFYVSKAKKAILRVLGLGIFHCYINGKRVGDDLYLPLNTDYEERPNFPTGEILSGHRIYVPEYDITSLIEEGENVLAIHFGGGWYAYDGEEKFGIPKTIWRIFGEDENNHFDFASSTNDRIGNSFIKAYKYTETETHDYCTDNADAISRTFDDTHWEKAVPVCALDTEYEFNSCPPDRVCERLPITKLKTTEDYSVYDCGKNISGYPVIRLHAKKNEKVKIVFSEELNPDNTLNTRFCHNQNAVFISDGKERTVRPLFTWFGFRYFAIYGDAQPLDIEVVHCAIDVTASFQSDNELLNWIHDSYINTQLCNMHSGIPTDCPHIERRGYTGDGQLTCHAVMNTMDAKDFYRKWIQDILDCQDKISGHVQYTAPYTHSGGGPGGWGCAIVEVPYQYYLHYGDDSVLRQAYPGMLRYFEYLESHSYGNLITHDKDGEWCLGDWCPPSQIILPPPFVNNYFYIKSLYRSIEIAKIIGKEEDIPLFEKRICERKEALIAAYYHSPDGNFIGNLQGANAFAIDIGLGDERTYQNLVDYYKSLRRYDTGIFGTDIVTRVLFQRGDGQLAVDLLLSNDKISFDGMRRAGATTFWECWPCAPDERSHNHPMFGAVVAYFYDYLLGIQRANNSVAYKEIQISPVIVEGVNRVSGWRWVPSGKIAVSYEKTGTNISFLFNIPTGISAVFKYQNKTYNLTSGENRFDLSL